jgi:hypothetical protein
MEIKRLSLYAVWILAILDNLGVATRKPYKLMVPEKKLLRQGIKLFNFKKSPIANGELDDSHVTYTISANNRGYGR